MKLKSNLWNKRAVIGFAAIIATGIFTFSAQNNSLTNFQNGSVIKSGVSTCFGRITQSFTSIMIGDMSSQYLSNDFTTTTGECFAEVGLLLDSNFSKKLKNVGKPLNKLTSDSYWFHEKLTKTSRLSLDGGLDLGTSIIPTKYEKLEFLFNESLLGLDEYLSGQHESITNYRVVNILLAIAAVLSVFGFWYSDRKQFDGSLNIEKNSSNMIQSGDFISAKVEQVMEKALVGAGMPITYELFNHYHASILERGAVAAREYSDDYIDVVDNGVDADIVDLNQSFTTALSLVQEKAFTYGVIVDFDLEEDSFVFGKADGIEQIIFNIINNSIDASLIHNSGRKVTVRSKALGGVTYLKTSIAHHCYSADELDYVAGTNDDTTAVSMQLVMTKELMEDFGGKLNIKNNLDINGSVAGSSVELIFNRTDAPVVVMDSAERYEEVLDSSAKLVSVVKGTKKSILDGFNG